MSQLSTDHVDPQVRCTLSDQPTEPHDHTLLETLPDGERARYLDYTHHAFPSHWGEQEQGMKASTDVKTTITGHCTGVVHTATGVITSHAPATTDPKQAAVKPSNPPRYPC